MHAYARLLQNVVVPEVYAVRRRFEDTALPDVGAAVRDQLGRLGETGRIRKGGSVAIGVGSRGIDNLAVIVAEVVSWFSSQGARPFIVPAMGSHGGATAEGQIHVLAGLGVTEDSANCPIRSCMDVVELGRLSNGLPVYVDALASEADGVFVINRVKPHTAFSGPQESGLVKMLTIGLGKQRGAESSHALGYGCFAKIMPAMAKVILRSLPVLGGLGLVENAYGKTCRMELVFPETFMEQEVLLLGYARACLPGIPVDELDVLLVHRMGKEISGSGVDPNVVGRSPTPHKKVPGFVTRVGILRLTEASVGNANGIGLSDVISSRLHAAINYEYAYTNVLTSTLVNLSFTPIVMPDDEAVLRCLIKTCNAPPGAALRFAYIRDTLTMDRMWVSPVVAARLRGEDGVTVAEAAVKFTFDGEGDLVGPGWDDFPV